MLNVSMTEISDAVGESRTYSSLLARFSPRPIRSDEELEIYLATTDRLMKLAHRNPENEALHDFIDLLSQLIANYEQAHHPVIRSERNPTETLRHIMKSRGTSQADLARILDVGKGAVSNVLAGGRPVPASWAAKLAREFDLPAEWFLER